MLTSKGTLIAELYANSEVSQIDVNESDNDSYFIELEIRTNGKFTDTVNYNVDVLCGRPDGLTYKIDVDILEAITGKYRMIIDNEITSVPGAHSLVTRIVDKENPSDVTYSLPFRINVLANSNRSEASIDFLASIQMDLIKTKRELEKQNKTVLELYDRTENLDSTVYTFNSRLESLEDEVFSSEEIN